MSIDLRNRVAFALAAGLRATKDRLSLGLMVLGLAAVGVFFGWAFYAMRNAGSWTGGSTAITVMILAGVLATGALAGALMWLAFYSSRRGYDQAPQYALTPKDMS